MNAASVTHRFYEAAWNAGDMDVARQLLAPDLLDHDPTTFPGRQEGADGLLQVVAMIRSGISDLHREVVVEIGDDEMVATRFTDTGIHSGSLFGIPATGRAVTVAGINIARVREGRIAELWHVEDIAGLMAQITA